MDAEDSDLEDFEDALDAGTGPQWVVADPDDEDSDHSADAAFDTNGYVSQFVSIFPTVTGAGRTDGADNYSYASSSEDGSLGTNPVVHGRPAQQHRGSILEPNYTYTHNHAAPRRRGDSSDSWTMRLP